MAAIATQNGRHMVQHVLLPVDFHFHWNLFIFEFLAIYFNFFNFYIGGHFEIVAISKILKTKSTTLSKDLFLCQVSKGSTVRSEFKIFCMLVTRATAAIWIFVNPQKLPHTTVNIPTKFHKVWWQESKHFLNLLFCVSMATAAKFVQLIPILFGLSRSTKCGCCSYQVSSISVRWVTCYNHFCVFFSFFSILTVSMATAAILKKSTLKGTTSHGIWYFYKVS